MSPDAVADVYLLVGRYPRRLSGLANRLLPPNVIYFEAETTRGRLAAKAAILSLDHFRRLAGPETFHSYVWARFAQPAALIWAADDAARAGVVRSMTRAARTFAGEVAERPVGTIESRDFWRDGFRLTYASELRAEGPERAEAIYRADQERYDRVHAALAAESIRPRSSPGRWRRRRTLGKILSILRLAKAIFTFEGGLDYVLWKVARHSGVRVEAKPWQRRWPLLAAPGLAFRVWRLGGFR